MSDVQVSGSRLWVAVNFIEKHALEKTRTSCRCVQPVGSHTTGRGLTFTSAHILVRAHVDGPGFSTHRHKGPQQCEVRALTPTLAFSPLHVCHRLEIGLAHAAGHGHVQSASASLRSISFVSRQKTTIHKIHDNFHQEVTVFGTCFNACLMPRRALILKLWFCVASE